MAETEAAAAPAATTPKKVVKKTAKAAKPAEHPKYSEMIAEAITKLKERKGSSAQAIKKYISTNFKVEEKSVGTHVRSALKRGVTSGQLNQVKGTGANGSFKLADSSKPKAAKETKSPKKTTPKKPAAAKKTAAKSPKKIVKKTTTAAKKTPTKSPKKSVKVAKSPAKKPVAKKATKKPAAKKAAAKK